MSIRCVPIQALHSELLEYIGNIVAARMGNVTAAKAACDSMKANEVKAGQFAQLTILHHPEGFEKSSEAAVPLCDKASIVLKDVTDLIAYFDNPDHTCACAVCNNARCSVIHSHARSVCECKGIRIADPCKRSGIEKLDFKGYTTRKIGERQESDGPFAVLKTGARSVVGGEKPAKGAKKDTDAMSAKSAPPALLEKGRNATRDAKTTDTPSETGSSKKSSRHAEVEERAPKKKESKHGEEESQDGGSKRSRRSRHVDEEELRSESSARSSKASSRKTRQTAPLPHIDAEEADDADNGIPSVGARTYEANLARLAEGYARSSATLRSEAGCEDDEEEEDEEEAGPSRDLHTEKLHAMDAIRALYRLAMLQNSPSTLDQATRVASSLMYSMGYTYNDFYHLAGVAGTLMSIASAQNIQMVGRALIAAHEEFLMTH